MPVNVLCRTASNLFKAAALSILVAVACDGGNATHARSQVAPWCAWDPGIDNFNCSFYTHQQCMATAWGNGGLCVLNPRIGYRDLRQRRRLR
jgi:hypothetical protein